MSMNSNRFRHALLGASAMISAAAVAGASYAADARQYDFDMPAQPLTLALKTFGATADQQLIFSERLVNGRTAPALKGAYTPDQALAMLLNGSGLIADKTPGGVVTIRSAADPQGAGASDGADGTVQALVVTAQKREENIQDVPIAMSAFTQEDLTRSQIAGGPDLITQVPNFSFTKTNFSSYSIQIRGIGTQAVSATTDPAVAVAFNNTPFIRNRFFEQEFYDLERVEVLRGPQGTLYGRNATAGVVNIISAKPKFTYASRLSADVANYSSTRLEGMVNLSLVEDKVALRVAGAWTKRDGYAFNQMTNSPIDGRDLWSTRVSLRFTPTDRIDANLIWEHFEENDDRLRSGKQLCKKDVVTEIGGIPVPTTGGGSSQLPLAYISQGCTRTSLYSPDAFQTPYGFSLPYYAPLADIGLPIFSQNDPYVSETQSRDLRVIESTVEPDYRAKTDVAELQVSFDLGDNLTLTSETAYSADNLFSLQDYNRFTTRSGIFDPIDGLGNPQVVVEPNGEYCDPQLGCSDRMLLVDLATSKSTQFSQELRLSSDFEGPFNFSLGANFLRHDAIDKYYVFINTVSLWADYVNYHHMSAGLCYRGAQSGELAPTGDPTAIQTVICPYLDPNPIGSLNDMGRNYFLSNNPYKLISYAAFGEAYYNISDNLKMTAGLRWTVDKKRAPQIPSWLLAGPTDGPYPITHTVDQEWREPTGRLALDWKPDLAFTDQTLVYASYAHGYKAGGANPPPPVLATYGDYGAGGLEFIPDTFDPEFVNAYEVGTKNTLLDGALTLNLTGFYYDYTGYQVSEIRNRAAVNSNYDATVWGAEVEADWRPLENLRLAFKGGYEKTRIADGETAIDLMDRTAGMPGWKVLRPFPSIPSNCILPVYVITAGNHIREGSGGNGENATPDGDCIDAYYEGLDPVTQLGYVKDPTQWLRGDVVQDMPAEYDDYPGFNPDTAPNGGRGFDKQLGGNELPNAPNWTATVTGDYTIPLANNWLATLHGDLHWQSASWWRVFNDHEYDRLDEFYTVNLAAIFTNEEAGWKIMAYVKNATDQTAITGAFLNSDDSGLTTNVFLTEPRLYGLRVTKDFTGSMFGWAGGEGHHAPTGPYPFQVEIGGGLSRFDNQAERYAPDWITPALASSLNAQDEGLDWGDIRSLKLSYQPSGNWSVSAAYMYGKTNSHVRQAAYEKIPGIEIYNGDIPFKYVDQIDNYAVTAVRDSEEFTLADFKVGKDVGLGALDHSTFAAGLRYASLESDSLVETGGVSGSYMAPDTTFFSGIRRHSARNASLQGQREFQGAGPSISWDASIPLLGDDQNGHVDLDWSIGGAILFGKQTVNSREHLLKTDYYTNLGGVAVASNLQGYVTTPVYDQTVPSRRSGHSTVPNLNLGVGLSYEVERIKISAGYSYDRFFDVIDGGVNSARQYDRTIDGPYFKIAVGFGG